MRLSPKNAPAHPLPRKKRLFDFTICLLSAPFWLPVLLIAAIVIWVTEGRPVLYVSPRRVVGRSCFGVIKFRTMVRNAGLVVNRDTVPINGKRFLNIPADSPLYTRTGRLFERLQLTELPQLFHVLTGRMSLVGNRPLPENVVRALRDQHANAEERFLIPGGLTGPVQLVGRDLISDGDRLRLEAAYCLACLENYSCRMDFSVLMLTVMLVLGMRQPLSVAEAFEFVERYRFATRTAPLSVRDDEPVPQEV